MFTGCHKKLVAGHWDKKVPGVSQGSVATCLRRGGIFSNDFIIGLLLTVVVKEFWQISTVAGEPAQHAALRQTSCKQRWTLRVINLQRN